MVKIETKIENRFPEKKLTKFHLLVFIGFTLLEVIFNTLLPFAYGFYFVKTGNLAFAVLILVHIFINVRIKIDEGEVELKFMRGL